MAQDGTPHAVPSGCGPLATHLALPELQEIVPSWQGFERAQVPPAVHETQLPALQTMLFPHDVPSVTAFPVSWQDIVPVWQLIVPV